MVYQSFHWRIIQILLLESLQMVYLDYREGHKSKMKRHYHENVTKEKIKTQQVVRIIVEWRIAVMLIPKKYFLKQCIRVHFLNHK